MLLECGRKPKSLEKTKTNRTCKLRTETVWPEMEPRMFLLWVNSANHCTIVPQIINQLLSKITLSQSRQGSLNWISVHMHESYQKQPYVLRKYIKTNQGEFKGSKKQNILASLLNIRPKTKRNAFLSKQKTDSSS